MADFGLSRELMVRDYYRLCHNKTPVPVRWMALECLEANVFTTMSDVVGSCYRMDFSADECKVYFFCGNARQDHIIVIDRAISSHMFSCSP